MRILVVAPHPDDEVLGVGGTLAKCAKTGHEIVLCVVTKAYTPDWSEDFINKRKSQIKKCCRILGICSTYFLDFPTAKLDTVPQKDINDSIKKVILDAKPDTVFVPFGGDLSRDHRIVFESSLVALRPISCKVKRVLAYETLSETEWGISAFRPNIYSDITSTLEDKINAMKCYPEELKKFPHPRSIEGIRALAARRGSEIGVKAAESFFIVREELET